jgi:hypothetical protein
MHNVFHVAAEMIREYGTNASFHSAARSEVLMDDGDMERAAHWRRISIIANRLERRMARRGTSSLAALSQEC